MNTSLADAELLLAAVALYLNNQFFDETPAAEGINREMLGFAVVVCFKSTLGASLVSTEATGSLVVCSGQKGNDVGTRGRNIVEMNELLALRDCLEFGAKSIAHNATIFKADFGVRHTEVTVGSNVANVVLIA